MSPWYRLGKIVDADRVARETDYSFANEGVWVKGRTDDHNVTAVFGEEKI